MNSQTVFLVVDHEIFRRGLRVRLEREPYIHVVGDSSSAEEALPQIRELSPDVVLMDSRIPGMGGVEATRLLKKKMQSGADIIILAECVDSLPDAMRAGAAGYFLKDMDPVELVQAIWQVHWNEHPPEGPRNSEEIVELIVPPPADAIQTLKFIDQVQQRLQASVLQMVGSGNHGIVISLEIKPGLPPNLIDKLRDIPNVEDVAEESAQVQSLRRTTDLTSVGDIKERLVISLGNMNVP